VAKLSVPLYQKHHGQHDKERAEGAQNELQEILDAPTIEEARSGAH